MDRSIFLFKWARDRFEGLFFNPCENVNMYLQNSQFVQQSIKSGGSNVKEIFDGLHSFLVTEKPVRFDECVSWARLKFEEYFNNNIQQLLYNFPKDAKTSSGAPFWSGPKRAPEPLVFDAENVKNGYCSIPKLNFSTPLLFLTSLFFY